MPKSKFKIIWATCLIITCVIASACLPAREIGADTAQEIAPPPPPPRLYMALGDSVAHGYGVEQKERYADLLYGHFLELDLADGYINYGQNGQSTTGLLEYLHELEADEHLAPELGLFADASVISINIGGNNILAPFIRYLPDAAALTQMVGQVREVMDDAEQLGAEVTAMDEDIRGIRENFQISDLLRLRELLDTASTILADSTAVFAKLEEIKADNPFSVLAGPLPEGLEDELMAGVEDFAGEFLEIINWLNRCAPEAIIIVNTVYNPLPEEFLGMEMALSAYADVYTDMLNEIIYEAQAAQGFLVADVHAGFAAVEPMSEVMNFSLNLADKQLNVDIIHPNARGHVLIADLCLDKFTGLGHTEE